MLRLVVRAQTQRAEIRLHRLGDALKNKKFDAFIRAVMIGAAARLASKTPRGFTGRLKKGWRLWKTPYGYVVRNDNPRVMLFLEAGTRAHGPVRAKFLFIPLTARAAKNGWNRSMKIGRDYVLAKRVRGIGAMRIVKKETVWVRREAQLALKIWTKALAKR